MAWLCATILHGSKAPFCCQLLPVTGAPWLKISGWARMGYHLTSVSFVAMMPPAQARHPSNAPKYRRTQTCLQRGSQLDRWNDELQEFF